MKFKQWFIQLLGLLTTGLSLVLIYLILFKDGNLQPISRTMLIEFFVVITLALSTKFFWYTSTESSVRSSDDYLKKRRVVQQLLSEEITDACDFDTFIDIENDYNYNRYVSNKCKNMTIKNYKLSFWDHLHSWFHHKDKAFYMTRYMLKVERDANKQHKLSGASIRSLTTSSDGLADDRNYANRKKLQFLISGAAFSFASMFLTAAVVFSNKTDFDRAYAITKMIIYATNILFSILQAILKARLTVATEDIAYFNRIVSIVEKYTAFKKKPYTITRVSYILEEVPNGDKNKSGAQNVNVDNNG